MVPAPIVTLPSPVDAPVSNQLDEPESFSLDQAPPFLTAKHDATKAADNGDRLFRGVIALLFVIGLFYNVCSPVCTAGDARAPVVLGGVALYAALALRLVKRSWLRPESSLL
jgi:hypothetical protein